MQPATVDDLREPLFDTLSFAKSAALGASVRFFTLGQSDGSKGPELTNLVRGSELPSPERMSVYSIQIEFLKTAAADLEAIFTKYCGRLVVSGKAKCTAPLEYFCAGKGLTVATMVQNGLPDYRAAVQFPDGYQIDIEAGNQFYFELFGSASYSLTDGTLGSIIRVFLDGVHTVPVV